MLYFGRNKITGLFLLASKHGENTPQFHLSQNTRRVAELAAQLQKAAGKPRFEYEEAVEEVFCFMWIDQGS